MTLALLSFIAALQGAASPTLRIQLDPDTVTVGDPFLLTLRVTAPAGARVLFPDGPGRDSRVRLLDPVAVTTPDTADPRVRVATYRLAAWDLRSQPIEMGNVVVEVAGNRVELAVRPPPVIVRSLLPADSSQRVPRPARAVFAGPIAWWYPWLPFVVLALLLTAIFIWWWRRRLQHVAVPSLLLRADRSFRVVQAMRLMEAGERGRHVALMVDVLREFLAARLPGARVSFTSAELVASAREHGLPQADRIALLVAEVDRIKFAGMELSPARAERLSEEAVELVKVIGDPPPVREAAVEEVAA